MKAEFDPKLAETMKSRILKTIDRLINLFSVLEKPDEVKKWQRERESLKDQARSGTEVQRHRVGQVCVEPWRVDAYRFRQFETIEFVHGAANADPRIFCLLQKIPGKFCLTELQL